MDMKPKRTVQFGELVAAVFDEAADYSSDPRVVSGLATRAIIHLLHKGRARHRPLWTGTNNSAGVASCLRRIMKSRSQTMAAWPRGSKVEPRPQAVPMRSIASGSRLPGKRRRPGSSIAPGSRVLK
jgi:hypothetical protein